jgi:hypothetical protein
MRARLIMCVAAILISVIAIPLSASAQSSSPSRSAAGSSAVPRTPWGDPDLQGGWTSQSELGVPFERPKEFGTRQELTDEEFAKSSDRLRAERDRDNAEFDLETADRSNAGAVGSATSPPPHWLERGNPSRRTSMVIDPPDGRVPEITADARARIQRQVRGSFGNGPWNGPKDFTLYDRCITRGVPGSMFPAVYNANTRIVQGPGFVAITYEMIHETRIIPVDGRDHIGSTIRQYHGDSRGRWEGDTLVVDARNFSDATNYRGSGKDLHLVERFTRVGANDLRYEVTVEDATTFAKPWTAALNLKTQPEEMFEYACHEGNHAMFNMLSAARAAEKAAADSSSR